MSGPKKRKNIPAAIIKNNYRDKNQYLAELEIQEGDERLVPDSVFSCLDTEQNRFVDAVNIRHRLNEGLLKFGGHVDDGVRPFERGKGIGTQMVALARKECRNLGIERVLMVCNRDNIASVKTILENETEDNDEMMQRYWISLK